MLVIKVKFNFVDLDIHVQGLAVSLVWLADKDDKLGEKLFLKHMHLKPTSRDIPQSSLWHATHDVRKLYQPLNGP